MRKQLLESYEILKRIGETSSGNEKIKILESTKGSDVEDTLKKIFIYAYHPRTTYHMGKTRLEGFIDASVAMIDSPFKDVFHLLDFLDSQSGVTDKDIEKVYTFFIAEPSFELRDLYIRMILKDLRIGVTDRTVNKVWEGLIPQFRLQLAKKYESRIKHLSNEEIAITPKLDGIRCATTIGSNQDEIKMWTRQYKPIEGLSEIKLSLMGLPLLPEGVLLDGELLYSGKEVLTSAERYRKTVEIVNSDMEDKSDIVYYIFDIVNLKEFMLGKTTHLYSDRTEVLDLIFANQSSDSVVQRVPILYRGNDHSKIYEFLDKATEKGEEGIMVNLVDKPYECKRTNNLLKVKKMHTVDLEVKKVLEGEGKYEGQLGSVEVEYKGYPVRVGSGFSDEQRDKFWKNKDLIQNKIIEIQYFEESRNKENEYSLRFPIFKRLRAEKSEESYD